MTYRINSAASLHWASWDDEYVIFNERSGQTHQMDSVRAFVVHCLGTEVHSINSLVAELADIPTLAEEFNLPELVKVILNEFCVHGLVEAVKV